MPQPPTLTHSHRGSEESWRALGRAILSDPSYPQAEGRPPDVVSGPVDTGARRDAETVAQPGALVRLFAHHESIDARGATEELRPLSLVDLERQGLLHRQGTRVTARFGIDRWGPVAILRDWPDWSGHPDYVMGISNAGRSLAWFTPIDPVATVLDLGTGSGIQALLAAHHADRVVAVDVNVRAVQLALASVRLNGLPNVDVRHGSWFEPVTGEVFDLVVSNPPFVISPEKGLVYRDAASEADDLCAALIADLPRHLAPGGRAVMLVEWARRVGEQWWSTPGRWLDGIGADGLAIRYNSVSPRAYATRWNVAGHATPRKQDEAVVAWLEYYDRLGLDEMYEGVVALRAPRSKSRKPAWWTVPAGRPLDGPGGEQLTRVLDGHIAADSLAPEEVLSSAVRPVAGHSLFQEIRFEDGHYAMGQIRGGFGSGIGVDVVLAPDELPVVLSLAGRRTLAEVVEEQDGTGSDAAQAVDVVTRLARAGLVELGVSTGGPEPGPSPQEPGRADIDTDGTLA